MLLSKFIRKSIFILPVSLFLSFLSTKVYADGTPIRVGSVENVLWDVVATIQFYTLPILAIVIALLGVKLMTSGDDISSKEITKQWIIKILIGGAIIFGATTIATIIKSAVGG
jgi:type IV secretory pathway VirB2 component (pilin)